MIRILLAAAALAAQPALAAPCPEPAPDGTRIEPRGKARLALGHATSVIAGGPVVLAACADVPGGGRVPARPQVSVRLAGHGGAPLVVRTESACDTVLLVATAADGWLYDDDGGGGGGARVVMQAAPDGRYDLFVGTWEGGTCAARVLLDMDGGSRSSSGGR